jgi:transposase
MSKALSVDLRVRVLAAVADGASHREAAARFGVSPASVSRWRRLEREQGNPKPGALGGDRRSGRIEAPAALIRQLLDEMSDATVEELRQVPGARGYWFGYGTLQRFFRRHRIRRKKTAHAAEQDCPDILKRRWAWFERQPDLEPDRLVFIDETWAKTNMARTHGRAPRGGGIACRHSAWTLANHDIRRGLAHQRHGGADGARRADQRRTLPRPMSSKCWYQTCRPATSS